MSVDELAWSEERRVTRRGVMAFYIDGRSIVPFGADLTCGLTHK